jgi:hypothetical protein
LWRQVDPSADKGIKIKNLKVRAKYNAVDTLLSTLPAHNIRQIHIQGGEPFLSLTHLNILKDFEKRGIDLSQVHLWYHSNGTIRVNDDVLKFWEKFKLVTIYFSIDDMGPRMEYQRWPLIWKEVESNLLWYKDNIPCNGWIQIERTVGVLSAYWADEVDVWHQHNFFETKFKDPIGLNYHNCQGIYSLSAITNEYKDAVLSKFSKDHWIYKTFINLPAENENSIKRMLAHLNKHDPVRNQDWRTVYPEFSTWYNRYL